MPGSRLLPGERPEVPGEPTGGVFGAVYDTLFSPQQPVPEPQTLEEGEEEVREVGEDESRTGDARGSQG